MYRHAVLATGGGDPVHAEIARALERAQSLPRRHDGRARDAEPGRDSPGDRVRSIRAPDRDALGRPSRSGRGADGLGRARERRRDGTGRDLRGPGPRRGRDAERAARALALTPVAALVAFALVSGQRPAHAGGGSIERRAPAFTVRSLEGMTLRLDALRARGPVVLDFWATWCTPCVAAIPELEQAAKDLGPRGLTIVGVSVDGPRNY